MTISREVKGDVMHCVSKYTYIYMQRIIIFKLISE
jgi:hypothetical protein